MQAVTPYSTRDTGNILLDPSQVFAQIDILPEPTEIAVAITQNANEVYRFKIPKQNLPIEQKLDEVLKEFA